MPISALDSSGIFNGLFTFIRNNIDFIGRPVIVSSSSNNETVSKIVYDPSNGHSWGTLTKTSDPQWILFDFQNYLIKPISYSLMSSDNPANNIAHLKGWDLLGSLNGRKWVVISEKRDSTEMNSNLKKMNFPCDTGVFRYLKLMQMQKGFTNDYGFSVRQVDVYGTIYENNPLKCTAMISSNHFLLRYSTISLIICIK